MSPYKLGYFPEDVVTAYLAYPYSDNPEQRTKELINIVNKIVVETKGRIALMVPHYMFDAMLMKFIHQGNWLFVADWELAVIEQCDVFIYGCELDYEVSPGMVWEAAFARRIGKPVLSVGEAINRYG